MNSRLNTFVVFALLLACFATGGITRLEAQQTGYYVPSAGTWPNLNISAGTAFCGNPPARVSHGADSVTVSGGYMNFVYLDPANSCLPTSRVTPANFLPGQIPIALVDAGTSWNDSTIYDARTWFLPQPCVVDASGSTPGAVTCAALGNNQNITLTPSGLGIVRLGVGLPASQSSLPLPVPQLTSIMNGSSGSPVTGLYTSKPDVYVSRWDGTVAEDCPASGILDPCGSPILRLDATNANADTQTMSTQIGFLANLWGYKVNTQSPSGNGNAVIGLGSGIADGSSANVVNLYGANLNVTAWSTPDKKHSGIYPRYVIGNEVDVTNRTANPGVFIVASGLLGIVNNGITRVSGVVTVTTLSAHGMTLAGGPVTVAGAAGCSTSPNGVWTLASVPTATTYTFYQNEPDEPSPCGGASATSTQGGNYLAGETIFASHGGSVTNDDTVGLEIASTNQGYGWLTGAQISGARNAGLVVLKSAGVTTNIGGLFANDGDYAIVVGTGTQTVPTNATEALLNPVNGILLDANGTNGALAAKNSHTLVFRSTDATPTSYDWTIKQTSDKLLRIQSGSSGSMADRMVLDSTGKVGIGTTTPAALLDVVGSDGRFQVSNSGATLAFTRPSASYILAASQNGYLDFVVNGNATTDATSSLKLAPNGDASFPLGKVGIGTTTPTTLLDVAGYDGRFQVSNSGAALAFTKPSANYIRATSSGGYLDFVVSGNATTDATSSLKLASNGDAYFLLYPNGKVGIGTTSPSQKLDVNGTINAAGGFTINASTPASGKFLRSDGSAYTNSTGSASGTGSCTNQVVTATNDDAPPTCASVSNAMLAAGSYTKTLLASWCTGTATANTTIYMPGFGGVPATATQCTGTTETSGLPMTALGTLKNLFCHAGSAGSGASSGAVTIRNNQTNSQVTCTIGTGTACSDTSHTNSVSAGAMISISVATAANETLANLNCAVEFWN